MGRKRKTNTLPKSDVESVFSNSLRSHESITENSTLASLRSTKSTKSRVAPRSGFQFKVGPEFNDTEVVNEIYSSENSAIIIPQIEARIDRGFENIDGVWIGYKRNYFTLVTSFYFYDISNIDFLKSTYYTIGNEGEMKPIDFFAIELVSICVETGERVPLIQHTAKRDKGPQISPPIFPMIPGNLPSHSTIKDAANIRNGGKIAKFETLFYLSDVDITEDKTNILLQNYPNEKISIAARYERIQFSTSLNCRKFSHSNHHFYLEVRLLGYTQGEAIILSLSKTPPLVIRGRSPSNYNGISVSKSLIPKIPKHNNDYFKEASLYEESSYQYFDPSYGYNYILNQLNPSTSKFKGYNPGNFEYNINKPRSLLQSFQSSISDEEIELQEDDEGLFIPQTDSFHEDNYNESFLPMPFNDISYDYKQSTSSMQSHRYKNDSKFNNYNESQNYFVSGMNDSRINQSGEAYNFDSAANSSSDYDSSSILGFKEKIFTERNFSTN